MAAGLRGSRAVARPFRCYIVTNAVAGDLIPQQLQVLRSYAAGRHSEARRASGAGAGDLAAASAPPLIALAAARSLDYLLYPALPFPNP